MNYLVPVQIGAPDYKNMFYLSSIKNNQDLTETEYLSKNSLSSITKKDSKIESINSYLAGFIEGDGHIFVPSYFLNDKADKLEKKPRYPYLAITFPNKDEPLIIHLQKLFGGNLRYKHKENAIVWIIGKQNELICFVNYINGYLRTPKIYEFNQLILWLNKNYKLNIKENLPDNSPLNENGWFSGFFDVDGGFKIRYTDKLLDNNSKVIRKERIEVRISIEQRQFHLKTNMPYQPIMESIAEFFTLNPENFTRLRTSRHNKDKVYWIVEVTSLSKLKILVEYLNTYPLFSSKRNDFKDWCIIYNMMLKKEHLNNTGKITIKNLKLQMNKNRTNFDWSHIKHIKK